MKFFKRILAAASAVFFIAVPAVAQNAGTVTNHAFALGKGPGVTGYTSLLCGSAQLAVGQSAADPICRTVTGDVTISAGGVTAIGTNKVTNPQIRQSGALSLIGRSANSTGNIADIQATPASSCVFMESASSLTCAVIATANIAANAITNANLATSPAFTLKGNASSSAASPSDIDVTALTAKASPVSSDIVLIQDSAAANAFKKATLGSISSAGSVSSIAGNSGAFTLSHGVVNVVNDISSEQMTPGGRLTLTSGTPVMATSVTAATTLYYAPMAGKYVPISSSGTMRLYDFTASANDAVGLSIVLGANWTANTNYDVFVALNAGVVTLGTGPDWSAGAVAGSNAVGASTRGTGAGSTDLQITKGFLTNKNSITLRSANATTFTAAANEATYLGTFRTGSAGQISFTYGAVGTAGTFNLWNAYNQVQLCSVGSDATASWTYVTGTFRQANASAVNQFNFVTGMASGSIDASYMVATRAAAASGAQPRAGLALNSITTADIYGHLFNGAATIFDSTITATNSYKGQLGANYISAIELSDGTNSNIYFGSPQQALRVCVSG